jgi:hypothetical protein
MQYASFSLIYSTRDLTLLRQVIAEAERSERHVTSILHFADVVFGNDQCIHFSHASQQDVDMS